MTDPIAPKLYCSGMAMARFHLLSPSAWIGLCLLCCALLLAPAPGLATPGADANPGSSAETFVFNAKHLANPVRLNYRVSSNQFPYRLNGTLLWQHDRQHYLAQMTFSAFGLSRTQTSRGLIGPDGLAPERFSDQSRSEASARFDRAQARVSFSANTPALRLLPGAQDRLSVLVQLGALVASEPAHFSPGVALAIQTIGPSSGEMWRFTVEKTEALALPGGPQPAVKLLRQPREPQDQRVEVWLAPALGYLPARIRISETNGDAIDQIWQSSETAPALD